jgi:hypothetical protein
VKIRLLGNAAECAAVVELLRRLDGVEVVEVSGGYANRGDSLLQRVYVEARLGTEAPQPVTRPRRAAR